jgi:quercetin dioxygenase-like cupin family protein
MPEKKQIARGKEEPTIEFRPSVFKTTLAYDEKSMLCRFQMPQGASIALHDHVAVQNGFIISGRLKFFTEDGESFIVGPGDGYVFSSYEKHGSEALEDVDFLEYFTPQREEYIPPT